MIGAPTAALAAAGGPVLVRAPDGGVACLIQIGRATSLGAVEPIAALDDVDALYVGPPDISNDLRLPADLRNPGLWAAAEHIAPRERSRHGRRDQTSRPRVGPTVRGAGFSLLSCSIESQLVRTASERTATALRSSQWGSVVVPGVLVVEAIARRGLLEQGLAERRRPGALLVSLYATRPETALPRRSRPATR